MSPLVFVALAVRDADELDVVRGARRPSLAVRGHLRCRPPLYASPGAEPRHDGPRTLEAAPLAVVPATVPGTLRAAEPDGHDHHVDDRCQGERDRRKGREETRPAYERIDEDDDAKAAEQEGAYPYKRPKPWPRVHRVSLCSGNVNSNPGGFPPSARG